MPFKSEKQRKYLWAKKPKIAKKWSRYKGKPKKKKIKKSRKKRRVPYKGKPRRHLKKMVKTVTDHPSGRDRFYQRSVRKIKSRRRKKHIPHQARGKT